MIREIDLYEILNNGGLGKCHLIDKKKGGCNGFIYLFYCEESNNHFVVCEGSSDTYFHYANYFSKLEPAYKCFKKIK